MFRRAVWDKLTRKVPLNQVERGYVLDGLYEECVRYCMYLDTFKYKLVLTSLLEMFPYLQEGLPSDDALMIAEFSRVLGFDTQKNFCEGLE
ncbi:hypothetical protein Pcinc_006305 [Petrolisthes cinctipes]|uniref:Uncharacterized protein n=1 Tax=Petrolisthes cinctipes TaxID=88211 RepID=A0AAE1GBQ7_PETCI|nr:hypothetical protein Pcinc_006305 [Petrolisthes cinctipes]